MGGLWDIGDSAGVVTCFVLWSAPDITNSKTWKPLPGSPVTSDKLADDQWQTIFSGTAPDPFGTGSSVAVLDVYLSSKADCSDHALAVTTPVVNFHKVRSTAQLTMTNQNITMINQQIGFGGWDIFGPAVSVEVPTDAKIRDTTYDGTFSFDILVDTTDKEISLADADADILVDDDPAVVGQRGSLDVKSDGIATGASATVQYHLLDANNVSVLDNLNPSGNNSGFGTLQDTEQLTVPVSATNFPAGQTGTFLWAWRWDRILTHNWIEIWAPVGSPVSYELYTRPTVRRNPTSAKPLAFWQSQAIDPSLLPIMLGVGPEAIVIATAAQAHSVLSGERIELGGAPSGKQSVCHGAAHGKEELITVGSAAVPPFMSHGDDATRPALMSSFAAELLAAKLNLARATQHGEPLAKAHIYGRTDVVPDVLSKADAEIATEVAICSLSSADVLAVTAQRELLRAVDGGRLAYTRGPMPTLPALPFKSNRVAAPSPGATFVPSPG